MARQVRFDPFGMQLAGEQAGLRDEAFLQDQTRRARASDYQFNTLNPLALNELQRRDTLGAAALPYDIDALGINQRMARANLYGAENPIYNQIGLRTGMFNPQAANDLSFLYNYSGIGMPAIQQQAQQAYYGAQQLPGFDPTQADALAQNFAQQYGVPSVDQNPMLDPNLYPGLQQNYLDYAMQPQAQVQNQNYIDYLKILQDQEEARLRAESSALWRQLQAQQQGLGGAGTTQAAPAYDPVDIF